MIIRNYTQEASGKVNASYSIVPDDYQPAPFWYEVDGSELTDEQMEELTTTGNLQFWENL